MADLTAAVLDQLERADVPRDTKTLLLQLVALIASTDRRRARDRVRASAPARRISRALRERVFERDAHTCRACGAQDDLQLDHIWPVARGGTADESNLQVLCRACNARKGAGVTP